MPKVTLRGYIEVPADDLDDVLLELPNHIALTHQEEGCLVFTVEKDLVKPHRFDVHEVFTDKASFERHQVRVKVSHWGSVTKNVARFYTITEG